ncbi:MAG: Lrp/AsnC family transcriptional regulator [archaeon]|nr:Lrp/AsnC family transcriptional regulator [archaeon]MCP8320276.1 Lrp/AsnC family transcriptional regulator [archaeon]
MGKIDEMDMKILAELVKNANLSVPKLSKKINVNPSVVYSRIKRLVKRNIIKNFTIIVNEELLGYVVTAVIGMDIDAKLRDSVLNELLTLREVKDVSEVTGRFDLIVSIRARSLDELHNLVSDKIGKINGILHTETFVEMKKRAKEPVYYLPK